MRSPFLLFLYLALYFQQSSQDDSIVPRRMLKLKLFKKQKQKPEPIPQVQVIEAEPEIPQAPMEPAIPVQVNTISTAPIYVCPKGYQQVTQNECERMTTKPATLMCPAGTILQDGLCLGQHQMEPDLTCPDGYYTNSTGDCERLVYSNPDLVCPDGYTFTKGVCSKPIEEKSTTTCPKGYALKNGYCSKSLMLKPAKDCPPGYELVKGDVCEKFISSRPQRVNCRPSGEKGGSVRRMNNASEVKDSSPPLLKDDSPPVKKDSPPPIKEVAPPIKKETPPIKKEAPPMKTLPPAKDETPTKKEAPMVEEEPIFICPSGSSLNPKGDDCVKRVIVPPTYECVKKDSGEDCSPSCPDDSEIFGDYCIASISFPKVAHYRQPSRHEKRSLAADDGDDTDWEEEDFDDSSPSKPLPPPSKPLPPPSKPLPPPVKKSSPPAPLRPPPEQCDYECGKDAELQYATKDDPVCIRRDTTVPSLSCIKNFELVEEYGSSKEKGSVYCLGEEVNSPENLCPHGYTFDGVSLCKSAIQVEAAQQCSNGETLNKGKCEGYEITSPTMFCLQGYTPQLANRVCVRDLSQTPQWICHDPEAELRVMTEKDKGTTGICITLKNLPPYPTCPPGFNMLTNADRGGKNAGMYRSMSTNQRVYIYDEGLDDKKKKHHEEDEEIECVKVEFQEVSSTLSSAPEVLSTLEEPPRQVVYQYLTPPVPDPIMVYHQIPVEQVYPKKEKPPKKEKVKMEPIPFQGQGKKTHQTHHHHGHTR